MSGLLVGAVVLYTSDSATFIADSLSGDIENKLGASFETNLLRRPSPSEKRSWRESLARLGGILQLGGIIDAGVSLEYQLPASSRRLDCMLAGNDGMNQPCATIIELKQWERCSSSDDDCEVTTRVQGSEVPLLHPSIQVGRYLQYLVDFNEAFRGEHGVSLDACAYLHNYTLSPNDPLLADKFAEAVSTWPIYGQADHGRLQRHLRSRTAGGAGPTVLRRIQSAPVRPSMRFLDHVGEVVRQVSPYKLLDNQVLAFGRVLKLASEGLAAESRRAVIVRGGPGTGKSVIALQLMGTLTKGLHRDARYVTGSGAFTKTLRRAMGPRAGVAFEWTNAFVNEAPGSIDVLIVDEAHRIREFSTDRIGRKLNPAEELQIDEILRTGRVTVFFIDDLQGVTPSDGATSALIRERAQALGIRVYQYELDTQFRCGGMGDFLPWLEDVLGIRHSELGPWKNSPSFEFKILDSPEDLDRLVRQKIQEGSSARIMAGFCWPWSAHARPDGSLEDDVKIGTFRRPWNARETSARLRAGIPKGSLWAYSPGGEDQIGCVYTAQGFEFDYAGVVFGPDLVYDSKLGTWVGHPEKSYDRKVKLEPRRFTGLVQQTYRVLLSRGLRGCYVCFLDADTREWFESHLAA